MIYGIIHRDKDKPVSHESLLRLLPGHSFKGQANTFVEKNVALGVGKTGVLTIDDGVGLAFSKDKKIVVAASGNIFNYEEVKKIHQSQHSLTKDDVAKMVLAGYENVGDVCFRNFNGNFSAAIWDSSKNRLILARDHLGFEPLYYFWDGNILIFSSSLKSLLHHEQIQEALNFRALRNYLLFNYNPSLDTLLEKVKKARPAHCLVLENDKLSTKRYWFLSYKSQNGRHVEDFIGELLDLTKDAIKLRSNESGCELGAFLSGGMDSSSVVGLLSGLVDGPIQTFSFRCPEKSVDESYYARVMAEHYKTQHNEILFTADELLNLEKMIAWLEEPFCDNGAEFGSYILGRAAQGKVKYILTGDGGDELYAGHPVYIADKIAGLFELIPKPLRMGITKTAQILPDSDKKKSLLVKTRRFAYSYSFPSELLSNRWRIYYNDKEIARLCHHDVIAEFGELNSYEDIVELFADADGSDLLSRSLYGDYQTLVGFHMDRLRLTRAFGIEARFPLHDYRLIEFAASIPSDLKIKGYSKAKYIQKKALEGILPDEIVFRKNKMGHNVPMKNWMREATIFRDLFNDLLSESALKKRNFFNPGYVQYMVDCHLKKKKDYSHRLYGLLILELWLQRNLDKHNS